MPEPTSAPDHHPHGPSTPTRFPVVNVREPASPPDRHPATDAQESAAAAGSSQSVAAAVAQVHAARAAAHAPEGDRRGDARDRLLAVLLDDPLRAVGAAVDRQDYQERLDRLTTSLGARAARRRAEPPGPVRTPPGSARRLSGLSDAEIAELLRRGPSA